MIRNMLLLALLVIVGCGPCVIEGPDAPIECESALDCDDSDPCTGERCTLDGECVVFPIGGECLSK